MAIRLSSGPATLVPTKPGPTRRRGRSRGSTASASRLSAHRRSTVPPWPSPPAPMLRPKFDIGTPPVPNPPPVAAFTSRCTGLTCTFTDGSTDDGTIAARRWSFGDGGTSTQTSPSHPYASGTYTVPLTVTDDKGATGTVSRPSAPLQRRPAWDPLRVGPQGSVWRCRGQATRWDTNRAGHLPQQQRATVEGPGGGDGRADHGLRAATCLDESSGQAKDGDPIIIWPCHSGPNQTWTYTSTGAITGINGKCIAIIGSPSVTVLPWRSPRAPMLRPRSSTSGHHRRRTHRQSQRSRQHAQGSPAPLLMGARTRHIVSRTGPSATAAPRPRPARRIPMPLGAPTGQADVTDDKGATESVSKTVSPTVPGVRRGSDCESGLREVVAVQGASHTTATPSCWRPASTVASNSGRSRRPGRQAPITFTMRRPAWTPRVGGVESATRSSSGPVTVAWVAGSQSNLDLYRQPGTLHWDQRQVHCDYRVAINERLH